LSNEFFLKIAAVVHLEISFIKNTSSQFIYDNIARKDIDVVVALTEECDDNWFTIDMGLLVHQTAKPAKRSRRRCQISFVSRIAYPPRYPPEKSMPGELPTETVFSS
jgi:hypothetical protein